MTTAIAHEKHGYSSLQIAFHWSVVALVAVQWFLGLGMRGVFYGREAGAEIDSWGPAYAHIALGVTILVLMLARLTLKLRRPVAVAPDSDHPWARFLGRVNHWIFYIVLILLPLGGALAWFGGSLTAARLHYVLAWALPWFIALHVAGALVHHFVFRDGLIRRMVRPT